jgi:hypothetical protein
VIGERFTDRHEGLADALGPRRNATGRDAMAGLYGVEVAAIWSRWDPKVRVSEVQSPRRRGGRRS